MQRQSRVGSLSKKSVYKFFRISIGCFGIILLKIQKKIAKKNQAFFRCNDIQSLSGKFRKLAKFRLSENPSSSDKNSNFE
jgi:hypothetical protein